MDPVSCLYNFLSIGILCYFVIICFLIKKCCMNCGKNCATDNLCKCFQKTYEGEITPSNHVILCDGDQRVPISHLINQVENEREYVVGDDGVTYRNEDCRECCMRENVSRSSCNSRDDVFVIKTVLGKEICAPCSPSALGLGQGSLRKSPSGRSGPPPGFSVSSVHTGVSDVKSAYSTKTDIPSCPASPTGSPCPASPKSSLKGSPPISVASELQNIITPGVEPILSDPVRKSASTKSAQAVEFKPEPEKHIFPADGSFESSILSREIRGSLTSQGSRTSCGSRTSRASKTSCGSRTSRASKTSCGSRTSKISFGGRSQRSGSPKTADMLKSASRGGSATSVCSKKSCLSITSRASKTTARTLISAKESQYSRGPGGIFYGPDGKPLNTEGVLFGPDGKPLTPGVVMYGPDSKPLGPGGYMYGPDGILHGPDGQAYGEAGVVYGKDGKPLLRGVASYGPDGKPLLKGVASYGPDGRPLLQGVASYGPDGKPLLQGVASFGPGGIPLNPSGISFGPDGKPLPPGVALYGPDGTPLGPGGYMYGPDGVLYGPGGKPYGEPGVTYGPDGSPLRTGSCSITSKSSKYLDTTPLVCDGSPDSSHKGPSPCKSLSEKSSCGSGPGNAVCPAREAKGLSKSSPCISPCKSGSGSASVQKSKSNSFKSPCGSPGTPCLSKSFRESSRSASPGVGNKNTSAESPCSKSRSAYQSTDPSFLSSEMISPTSTFSSHGAKTSVKSPCGICSKGSGSRGAADKPPSPILKSPDDSCGQPCAKGVTSPTRVSIKDKYDIITPEGITSAPTFGKDECSPCPFSKSNQSFASTNAGRQNQNLADEYKDNSRGSKTGRSPCNTNTCSQVSSYKGKSWPTTPSSAASKSATISTATTSKSSGLKCSKCSSKFSSVTDITLSSSKTKPSGTSSCVPSCKKSGVSSNGRSDFQTESVTTADIDDFRNVSPSNSKCENLGAVLANNPCGKIRRLLKEVTCEAIIDPSAEVSCADNDGEDECAGIQFLRENADCPSLLEYIEIVDKMTSGGIGGGQKGGSKEDSCNRPTCPSTKKLDRITSSCSQARKGSPPRSPDRNSSSPPPESSKKTCSRCKGLTSSSQPEKRRPTTSPPPERGSPGPASSQRTCSRCASRTGSNSKTTGRGTRTMSATGGSSGVDARVIHEISTKVQNCLNHARAIAKKIDDGGAAECRKTMRISAKSGSKTASQAIKLNSKVMLNTRGVRINEYNKVNKQFGPNTGIEVKYKDKQGNVEKFKKPYSELITPGMNGAINIRISSPCKSTPGKKLCVSTDNNPCCSSSTSRAEQGATRKHSPPRVKIVESKGSETETSVNYAREESTTGQTTDQECPDPEICRRAAQKSDQAGQKSDQECPDPEVCRRAEKRKKGKKDTIIMYERSTTHQNKAKRAASKRSSRVECTPSCTNCKKTSCPASKHKKSKKTLQVYNVTTSHFSAMSHGSHFVKVMPIPDSRILERYIYPDRYRGGESYFKKRRELIRKIKGKCPWS